MSEQPADSITTEQTPDAPVCAAEFSEGLPDLLREMGSSLLVSTYSANRLIVVRPDGEDVNTHYLEMERPMGMALHHRQLAIGSNVAITQYADQPELADGLEPAGNYDAVYVPRRVELTGDVDIHEMAFDSTGQLWYVNTMFSCLCKHDPEYSFTPHWRPSFVSALAREDRCHLNGLGMRDGKPRYVTALGTSDSKEGWRDNKANGGVLIDVRHNRLLAEGLAMPHSPRWHQGRLWLLESGKGSLATIDPESGAVETVVTLPGFTRGLEFIGKYALVGVSKAREKRAFAGLPGLAEPTERECGVYVVDIEQGEAVGLLRFTEAVDEIFALLPLSNQLYPEVLDMQHPLTASAYILSEQSLKQLAPDV